ncbi:HNH endonuclease signature motif containing protein [Nocardioides terrisoli]|uniref:HNH endonuclease signature motif containing protein n=1 Tax=Nocardioides terrisoli TaxID=3388267 RepID=UPI00287B5CAF|nr:hypothetical protein [Nocardioides marmorisolisilvae]
MTLAPHRDDPAWPGESALPMEDCSPVGLAHRIRDARARVAAAETEVVVLALAWADAHPELGDDGQPVSPTRVDDDALAAHFVGIDPEQSLDSPAWAGLPPVAWDAPAGLAAACGLSTAAGRGLLRDVLVLAHRLPAIWARTRAGQVPAWRARMIATEVAGAPDDVVAAIDAALAPVADRAGQITVRRLVGEVMLRLYPEQVEAASLEALDRRYVRFDKEAVGHTGVSGMDIRADYADLDDLDTTLTALAEVLDRVHPDAAHDTLAVRRARALGVLADPALAHQLLTDVETSAPARIPGRSRTVLELRISDLALLGLDPVGHCRPETTNGFVTLAERIAAWCGRPATDLTVLPVLDPDAHRASDAYQVVGRLREIVDRRDRHCLFPYCTHPATACDHDHVHPYATGGSTCTCNLIPLCRHHHRLKTHAGYHAAVVEPGVVTWTTPHGHRFVVNRTGTLPSDRPPPLGARTSCFQESGRAGGRTGSRPFAAPGHTLCQQAEPRSTQV